MVLLRNKPTLKFSGLTIILSNPSRFDVNQKRLLSAGGGLLINNHCLRPDFNLMQCDVRVADDAAPFMDGTKCILLLGEYAMHKWIPDSRDNTLNELRGSLLQCNGLPAIATYYPQDAVDIKNYEKDLNPEHKMYEGDEEESKEDEEGDNKTHGNTKRSNYAFWIRADVKRCKTILQLGIPRNNIHPIYKIYPSSKEVIEILSTTKGQWMDFDIETDYEEQNLQCFAFSFDSGRTVYSVPAIDFNYTWAYTNLHRIIQSLSIAIRDNTLVAHNGAAFDFFVLGYKYHITINKVWDTMAAMHRCFPDIEKSLGHCVSYWTWERFHKDEDSRGYRTKEQMMDRLKYCGKDVFTMSLVRQSIQKYARTIPGLEHSISTVMEQIKPYLITSLQGIKLDYDLVKEKRAENDRLMMQYKRIIDLLIGDVAMQEIRQCVNKSKSSFANSNPQCVYYFHKMLEYPVVQRGKPNAETGERKPSLAAQALFKLRLQHDNPVIDFTIAYRQTRLETTTPLGMIPWKDDNNNIIDINKWTQEPH